MIPNKIKIGGMEYQVNITDKPIIINNDANYGGCIYYNKNEIQICEDLAEEKKKQVFWHEVLHGIVCDRNIDLGDKEEMVVDMLSYGILAFLKDNKYPLPGQGGEKSEQ